MLQERNRWLRRFGAAGLFTQQDIADALLEPLEVQRHAAPTLAPHLARRLVRQFPGEAIIRSSVQRNKQSKAEDLTRNYVRRLYELGITQASVLVVNNRTRQVEAYVGSADFHGFSSQGQNDGIVAVRSPGSTLKPFLYALAMDRGLVTPKLVLPDVPTNFQGYRPENFDKHCNGEVTLERALAYSLNIPAVRVLNELGVPTFTDKLRQAGFQNVTRNRANLGLSSILGGCGASLEELTNLYVTLANDGRYRELQYRLPHPPAPSPPGKGVPNDSRQNTPPLPEGRGWGVGSRLFLLPQPSLLPISWRSLRAPICRWVQPVASACQKLPGKPALATAAATPGALATTSSTPWACGWATSAATAAPPLLGPKLPHPCCSMYSMI
ncbi:penicillin-binding transpeptidase domain-containing protein [Hymenobacter volaticus]|uniref:penicillin-binding transpeptidase domain-containing protein n=1 Tax=Hymenobacter volaticus TaxID=2932254 RepID=UPI0035CB2B27